MDLFEKQQYHTTRLPYELYATAYTLPDDDILTEITRRTHLNFTTANMLSGVIQGRLLQMLCRMLDPSVVLEIGTYTGYSAISMARGMEKGKVHTIDNNPEVEDIIKEFLAKAGLEDKIIPYTGNAADILPEVIQTIGSTIDLVFIDADKENYIRYYEMVIDHVRPGGFIIADNVLWYGRVLDEQKYSDKETKGIIAFNNHVKEDSRVDHLLLPVRDGLMILYKK